MRTCGRCHGGPRAPSPTGREVQGWEKGGGGTGRAAGGAGGEDEERGGGGRVILIAATNRCRSRRKLRRVKGRRCEALCKGTAV